MSTIVLQVEGMKCDSCVKHVNNALRGVDGVSFVAVDREAGQAQIEGSAGSSELIAALKDAGYPAAIDDSASV